MFYHDGVGIECTIDEVQRVVIHNNDNELLGAQVQVSCCTGCCAVYIHVQCYIHYRMLLFLFVLLQLLVTGCCFKLSLLSSLILGLAGRVCLLECLFEGFFCLVDGDVGRPQGVVGLLGVLSDYRICLLDNILQVLCYDFREFKLCPTDGIIPLPDERGVLLVDDKGFHIDA